MWNEYEITPNNALQYKKEELNDLKAMKKKLPRQSTKILLKKRAKRFL